MENGFERECRMGWSGDWLQWRWNGKLNGMEIKWNIMGRKNGMYDRNKYLIAYGIKEKYNVIWKMEWSIMWNKIVNRRKLKLK